MSEKAALPFRLDSIPERAHIGLLFIHGHHVHVAPTLVPDDPRVHGSLTDAGSLKVQKGRAVISVKVRPSVTP